MTIYLDIEKLLYYAETNLMLDELDVIYARNLILNELRLSNYEQYEVNTEEVDAVSLPSALIDPIVAYAVENGISLVKNKQKFASKILYAVSKRPSEIVDLYYSVQAHSPKKAADWLEEYFKFSGGIFEQDIRKACGLPVKGKKQSADGQVNEELQIPAVEFLLAYGQSHLLLDELDIAYARKMILDELKVSEYSICEIDPSAIDELSVPDPVLDPVIAYAIENKAIKEADKAKLSLNLMNYLIKRPSEITDLFLDLHKKSPQKAFEWLYDYSIKSNYVSFTEVAKNKHWEAKGTKGKIELTINLSRPENDNKQVEKAAKEKAKGYPYCSLCKENEGFGAAVNLRTVPVTLGGEEWFWQYSPYSYFNQHGVLINSEHTPMTVDRSTFSKLLQFTDFMPGYFIGSNASLPLVGGSILSHEHFQGGKPVMPMFKAPVLRKLKCAPHPYVKIELIDWYNTVIRVSYTNKENLADFAEEIRRAWENYSDPSVAIEAKTGTVKHNAVTPIARRYPDGSYSLDLILRNNRTTDDAPDGVFGIDTAHRPIKKEAIALTESMGWFILPGRLLSQLSKIERFLTKETRYNPAKLDEDMKQFIPMIEKLIKEMGSQKLTAKEAELNVRDEVNRLCEEILYKTAVFKRTEEGVEALNKFLSTIDIE